MCFSATASFAAAGVLATTGVIASRHAFKYPSFRAYAAIPLFFAGQQAIEGLQWLADKPSLFSTILGYGFIFFAFLFWPSFIPYAVYCLETNAKRKRLLRDVMIVGMMCSLYLLTALLYNPLTVAILGHSIDYRIYVAYEDVGVALYVAVVCGSALLSTRYRVKTCGLLTLVGFLVTTWAFNETFTSVWCFFAAILSVLVLWEVMHIHRSSQKR